MTVRTATMIVTGALAISVMIGVFIISAPAQAQSFSCANAQIPSEFAVCNNEDLLVKDERLASLFANALVEASRTNAVGEVASDHSLWLKQRNACKNDFVCLDKRYEERLQALED